MSWPELVNFVAFHLSQSMLQTFHQRVVSSAHEASLYNSFQACSKPDSYGKRSATSCSSSELMSVSFTLCQMRITVTSIITLTLFVFSVYTPVISWSPATPVVSSSDSSSLPVSSALTESSWTRLCQTCCHHYLLLLWIELWIAFSLFVLKQLMLGDFTILPCLGLSLVFLWEKSLYYLQSCFFSLLYFLRKFFIVLCRTFFWG